MEAALKKSHNPHGIAAASTPLAQHFTAACVTPLIFPIVVLPVLYFCFPLLLSFSEFSRERERLLKSGWIGPRWFSQSGMPTEAPFLWELITQAGLLHLALQLDSIDCRIQLVWLIIDTNVDGLLLIDDNYLMGH